MSSDAPSPLLTLMEGRALFEIGALQAASPLLRLTGRGDRHPVLVLPGFTADDRSTAALRGLLRAQGYWTHGWGLGRNMGPTPRVVEGMLDRFAQLHERHGRKVSLVGWSLGGVFARELARTAPDAVRQVITLGSPFRMGAGDRSAASPLWDSLQRHHEIGLDDRVPEHEREPLAMPATAIYTRTDGVVNWWHCVEATGAMRESIEVRGSHSGLGFNPAVAYAVLDRLAQPEDNWRPFHAPLWLRSSFPRPEAWDPARGGNVAATG